MDSDDDSESDRCAICLDYQNCDSIPMECCNKLIHSYCLVEWLHRRNNCPLCRTEQSSGYNDDNNFINHFPNLYINSNEEPEGRSIFNFLNRFQNDNHRNSNSDSVFRFNDLNLGATSPIPPPAPLRRERRRGFYLHSTSRDRINNLYSDINRIRESMNRVFNEFHDIELGLTGFRYFEPQNLENNDNENEDILNINYLNSEIDNMLQDLGITSQDLGVSINRSDNNININFNDLNININNDDFSNIENIVNDVNEFLLENVFNFVEEVDDEVDDEVADEIEYENNFMDDVD